MWINLTVDDQKDILLTGHQLPEFVINTLFPALKGSDLYVCISTRKAVDKSAFADANQYMKDGVLSLTMLILVTAGRVTPSLKFLTQSLSSCNVKGLPVKSIHPGQ